jgi:hypothetical protein
MLITAAALLLLVCAGVVRYARVSGTTPARPNLLAIASQASDAVGAAVVSGLSAVTERSGLGRLLPADEATVETPAAPDPPPVTRQRLSRTPPSPEPSGLPIVVFDLAPPPNAGTAASAAADLQAALESVAWADEVIVVDAEEETAVDEALIFSSDSEGVSPPVGVRPQLPSELPANLTTGQLSRVELIISEVGTVDSVKLLGTPHTVHDFMFLSAAKAWQFRPALKDGVPVRYRKTVWIASQ